MKDQESMQEIRENTRKIFEKPKEIWRIHLDERWKKKNDRSPLYGESSGGETVEGATIRVDQWEVSERPQSLD